MTCKEVRRQLTGTILLGLVFVVATYLLFAVGCATTKKLPESKAYEIKPYQVVNQVTILTPEGIKWLITLSNEDLTRVLGIFETGGVVMSMGAWSIKVQGIQADDTMTSEATSEQKADLSMIPK